ncbi:MAG: hypothetical protein AB8B74_06625 [Crocinitomicaceae bacterium]
MKKIYSILTILTLALLSACSGSDTYRGNWKATDSNGTQFDLNFEAKTFSVKNQLDEITTHGYTQNSININNSIETYGIKLDDGRSCQINFPIADDESKGIITDGSGIVIYTISRTDYINYNDLNSLH